MTFQYSSTWCSQYSTSSQPHILMQKFLHWLVNILGPFASSQFNLWYHSCLDCLFIKVLPCCRGYLKLSHDIFRTLNMLWNINKGAEQTRMDEKILETWNQLRGHYNSPGERQWVSGLGWWQTWKDRDGLKQLIYWCSTEFLILSMLA